MSNTADLLKRQQELQGEITALYQNDADLEGIEVRGNEFYSNHVKLTGKVAPNHDYFVNNIYGNVRQICEAAHERKRAQEQQKIEQASKEMDTWARSNSRTDNAVDRLVAAIETRIENIRPIIEEAKIKIKMNTADEDLLESYENRIERMWSFIEKYIDELTIKYSTPYINVETEDLSCEVMDIVRMLKKQKTVNLKKTEDKLELPKIELPKFSGELREWQQFKELFEEYVHDNKDISDSKKLSYLKTCLQGDARQMVSHLIIGSGANYNTAWELLVRRNDNTRKQFNDNLERLVELPMLTDESAYKMKKFLDTANESIAIIKKKGTFEDVLFVGCNFIPGAPIQYSEFHAKIN